MLLVWIEPDKPTPSLMFKQAFLNHRVVRPLPFVLRNHRERTKLSVSAEVQSLAQSIPADA